jgi:hypothetical protein
MRKKLLAISILPIVLLLALVPAIISFAQVPGDERKTEGGIKGPVLGFPPHPGRLHRTVLLHRSQG